MKESKNKLSKIAIISHNLLLFRYILELLEKDSNMDEDMNDEGSLSDEDNDVDEFEDDEEIGEDE